MMLAIAPTPSTDQQELHSSLESHGTSQAELRLLDELLAEIQTAIAPLWPLQDYVAVNPFVGFTDRSFLAVREDLRTTRDGEMLMPLDYFRAQVLDGIISIADIELALQQCRREYPAIYSLQTVQQLLSHLDRLKASETASERKFRTVAEVLDQSQGSDWAAAIANEISRHCAAHYDQGQAIWSSPWQALPLYHAWREAASIDRRFEKLGVSGFRKFVSELPASPQEAILHLLTELNIPSSQQQGFLLCQLYSVSGWASYVKYRVRQAEMAGRQDDDLIGLLAMRLAYDCKLSAAKTNVEMSSLCQQTAGEANKHSRGQLQPSLEVLYRYLLQVAAETAYRRRLCSVLVRDGRDVNDGRELNSKQQPKQVQMVFCIDVRSEVIRRNLESVTNEIETLGFAGFFGLAMQYLPLGSDSGSSQCPVLLKPGLQIREYVRGAALETQAAAIEKRRGVRLRRQAWKAFQSSAASCFTFVESMGVTYLTKLVSNSFRLRRSADASQFDGVSARDRSRLGPVLPTCGEHAVTLEQQIDLAAGMLRNLGLTNHFARIVVICGHASETTNNPYRAGLDCGACGGHSGESNARVAATLLNNAAVRHGLKQHGIEITPDVWFAAAVHNTTTDEIRFFDLDMMPDSHLENFQELQKWVVNAGELTRTDRALRMGTQRTKDLIDRSCEWSEVRPEWGLAGNAAFIVAPRARTRGLKLEGRTFMHSYDYKSDQEDKVLELIMTAPMVVANWINLQYYASTVDNRNYGSGNKVIHNVVGQLGILEGNGGDLMTGLPWQSLHDGKKFQHEPLRLLVVIEAPRAKIDRILTKHQSVQDLVGNGWLCLMAIENENFYQYSASAGWETFAVPACQ